MPSLRARWTAVCLVAALSLLVPALLSAQGTGGRIIGRVADSSGAVLANVKVTLVNEATNVSRDATTNSGGDYDFIEVPVGTYRLEFDLKGFKKNIRRGVALDINQVITLNMTMAVGATQEVVDVTSEAPLVETTSTQLGAVMGDRAVSELPLNSRDTYQLLQLQPGVMSTVGSSNSIVYGSSNAGAVSVNGGRGRSNNFTVNGGDANDQFVNLPTVQPSPDSIQEFRVLTNTFDAEYGRNSGSIVNVVTKSGSNQFHGNMYEFFRNKVLNANAYCFSSDGCTKPKFNQNQFGGTFGGPIKKDRTFFFTSYEGRRIREGVASPAVPVPTAAERPSPTNVVNTASGPIIVADYSEGGAALPFSGLLNNSWALQPGTGVGQRPGCQAAVTALGGAPIADGVAYSTIFPNNQIPLACMDATAVDLLQLVPLSPSGGLLQTVPVQPERGDQFTVKLDHRINDKQNLSFYYYFDDHSIVFPFAQFQAAGANVPGFASATKERFQQWNLSHTWTINNSTVNEFRFNYNREAQRTFQHPQRTSLIQASCPAAPSWLTGVLGSVPCFSDGTAGNAFGIHPGLGAQHEGLPFIQVSGGFTIGNNGEGELPQVGNSFQWSDSISKVKGNHSMKFGVDARRQRFDQTLYFDVNGEYFVDGTSANTVGADISFNNSLIPDYLLGFPGSYGQGSAQVEHVRSTGLYLFAQDSWKLRPNLTLNYGLRWELNTPIADVSKHVQTFRPGQNSTIYPCQLSAASIASLGTSDCTSVEPTGLVVPGDAGVPTGLTQTYYKAFAPRIGIAWSPGNSGKTSIRAGWGLFYNPIEQLVLEQFSAEPPFGGSTFPVGTLFNTPFLGQDGTTVYPNPFNGILNPPRGQPVDWSIFRPILLFGQFQPKLRSQYSAQYNLTIQRELTRDLKLQVGYVGSQGHRLLATHDVNYGNPQTCLDLEALAQAYPGNPTNPNTPGIGTDCGPYFSDSAFSIPTTAFDANGNQVNVAAPAGGLHLPYGPNGPSVIPAGTLISSVAPNGITLVGTRRYSSPHCDPLTGNGCPPDGIPVFSSIFAQDTIANSAYNSFQASLEKRFAHGLQFTAAYTFSKSFDEASSFEGILNPIDPARSRSLSSFDARHRIVLSYYWEMPKSHYSGAAGHILNGWAISGVTTLQTGFPIRITSLADNELMYSFDFELPGEPAQIGPFQTMHPQSNGNYFFNPNSFTENATDSSVAPCSTSAVFGCYQPSLFGTLGTARRTICCGPHISNTDFALLKSFLISETKRVDFRAEVFNIFNHTQFFNPDGSTSDGPQFGQVTQARDPRLMQFALKFFF
jgi:Carboxypeptidase regulatory-like domain